MRVRGVCVDLAELLRVVFTQTACLLRRCCVPALSFSIEFDYDYVRQNKSLVNK